MRIATSDDPTTLLLSVDDAAPIPLGLGGAAADTLHITAQPTRPPGGFQVWLCRGPGDGRATPGALTKLPPVLVQ